MKARWLLAFTLLFVCCGCTIKGIQKFVARNDDGLKYIGRIEKVTNYERDVVWAEVGDQQLLLDVSWPEGEGPFPIVVNIHGGGWVIGSKEMDEPLCRYLTNRGYVVYNIEYRLAPDYPFPAAVNDCLGAVIWAKDHAADYNGDASRVAVMGGSAGGNLAAMVALAWNDSYFTPTFSSYDHNASVQAAVVIFGVFDLAKSYPDKEWVAKMSLDMAGSYLGGSPSEAGENYNLASPVYYLDRAESISPMLIVCGDKDGLYPQSQAWDYALTERGVPHEFHIAYGKDHAFTNWHWQKAAKSAYASIVNFLDHQLKG